MDKLLSLLRDLLPLEIAALIIIFIYFLKLFRNLASDFNKIAQQQAEYMRQRVESVDKTTTIFERTVEHQERDLQRLYEINEKLKRGIETKKEEGVERLDKQLDDVVEGLEQVRQEKISKEEFERLKGELSAAKQQTSARYSSLIQSLSDVQDNEIVETSSITKAFVVTSYTTDASHRYELIREIVSKAGVELFRADEVTAPGGNIASHVKRCIEEADLILVDITGKNPNVMYELGYTHALAKPVILLAADKDEIPFDSANYRIIIFDETTRGVEILRRRLTEAIHDIKVQTVKRKAYKWLQAVGEAVPYGDFVRLVMKLIT